MNDEFEFASAGDDWLLSYATVPKMAHSVRLFSAGHAAECFLKAAFIKQGGGLSEARRFGHNSVKLLHACQNQNADFLQWLQMNEDWVKQVDEIKANVHGKCGAQADEFLKLQEVYDAFWNTLNFKYLPTKKRDRTPFRAAGYSFPSSIWTRFFREIRIHIGWPPSDTVSSIHWFKKYGEELDGIGNQFISDVAPELNPLDSQPVL
jgi:hypothetical protein